MRRRPDPSNETKVDLTPMIDIVFNLLIFFMCVTSIRTGDFVIQAFLPKDKGLGTAPTHAALNDVRVKLLWHDDGGLPTTSDTGHAVIAIGALRLNAPGELEAAHPEANRVWADLHDKLIELRDAAPSPDMPVIIDARAQVPTKHVISVLNAVVKAKLKDVTFAAPGKDF